MLQSKMRYEIYQLKISLNIPDDSEDDEECGLWQAQPPTPPKVLDEDKALAKLQNYLVAESASTYNLGTKSVILIDANPELLITERDILLTLVDMNVDPSKADRICRKLLMRSRDQSSSLSVSDEELIFIFMVLSYHLMIAVSWGSRDSRQQSTSFANRLEKERREFVDIEGETERKIQDFRYRGRRGRLLFKTRVFMFL